MLDALVEVLPRRKLELVVASGTHAATDVVVPEPFRDLPRVVHDGNDVTRLRDFGSTSRGTRVRVLREVADSDLVIATGRLRPHYFAGYSGGAKSIFPGCGHAEDILKNHLLKSHVTARLGRVHDNVCRADMEEAARKVGGIVLNVLMDCDGAPVAAVTGDIVEAHRELVRLAEPSFLVRAPRARVVVVADRPPVSRSLYQASKLLPPAGAILEDGGTIIVVAECDLGVEPLDRVNEGIYRSGVAAHLPEHRVVLVSQLEPSRVAMTYAASAPSLRSALQDAGVSAREPAVLLWRAGEMITQAS